MISVYLIVCYVYLLTFSHCSGFCEVKWIRVHMIKLCLCTCLELVLLSLMPFLAIICMLSHHR